MLKDMKQFVPSEVCLSCDGCCRFKEEKSVFRPKVEGDEFASLADNIFPKAALDSGGHIKAIACTSGEYICTFFDPQKNTCKIYHFRPFECQLYPFVISREQKEIILNVHLPCPFVEQNMKNPVFSEYVEYLKEFFQRADVVDFIKKNSSLVSNYAAYEDELLPLFAIS